MIGNVRGPPGRPAGRHLDDAAAEGPDVAGAAVTVAAQHLRRHEGDGALQLALELPRHRPLPAQPGSRTEVRDPQVVAGCIHKQVGTWVV